MRKPVNEDNPLGINAIPPDAGRQLLMGNLRKVLIRRGYRGAQLESRIREITQRDFPRVTAAMMRVKRHNT